MLFSIAKVRDKNLCLNYDAHETIIVSLKPILDLKSVYGGPGGARTLDTLLKRQVL